MGTELPAQPRRGGAHRRRHRASARRAHRGDRPRRGGAHGTPDRVPQRDRGGGDRPRPRRPPPPRPPVPSVTADALEFPLPPRPWRAVGNLPYNVATPIVRRVVASEHWRRAVFMLQKEVADRLVARPGTEPSGFLTLFVQLYAKAKVLMTLDPRSFYPPPKVRSSVGVLKPDRKPYASEELIELISAAFRMRRKTLANNLTGWRGLSREDVLEVVPSKVRAEALALDDFVSILTAMSEVSLSPRPSTSASR